MKFSTLRKYAMALPEVTEEPHHHFEPPRLPWRLIELSMTDLV